MRKVRTVMALAGAFCVVGCGAEGEVSADKLNEAAAQSDPAAAASLRNDAAELEQSGADSMDANSAQAALNNAGEAQENTVATPR